MATVAPDRFTAIQSAVEAAFRVNGVEVQDGRLVFEILPSAGDKERFLRLREALEPLGVLPLLRQRQGRTVILLSPKPPPARPQWALPVALFAATFGTTFLVGYEGSMARCIPGLPGPLFAGVAFSLSLMAILFCHEMGHKLVSIRRGIDASLPFFIPMPPLFGFGIGTMGAVILTRTPAPNRDALFDLGASGPLAGFIVAIPILVYGIAHSVIVSPAAVAASSCHFTSIPTPRLVDLMQAWLLHPATGEVFLHPMAFAGWVGLLVTGLNLLPAGMLDGGHVTRAVMGPRAHGVLSVVGAGIAAYFGYVLMAALILLLLRRGHPGPLDDCSALSPGRRFVACVLVGIFVLSFVPLTVL
jgi:membrane-associated protease RseP (regulator of RpoE activity)